MGLHQGRLNAIKITPDGNRLITAGEDGAIFVLRIREQSYNFKEKQGKLLPVKEDTSKKKAIVDPALANIVLVKRNEVEEWQERYKRLKYDLALKRKKVTLKLDNCRKRF